MGDGSRITSGSVDKTVRVWDVATKECVATLKGHTDGVFAVCGLGDGSRIASGSGDNTVRVWDVATKECVATLEGHTRYVMAVCSLGDGSRIASGSQDNTVRVSRVAAMRGGRDIQPLRRHVNMWCAPPRARRTARCPCAVGVGPSAALRKRSPYYIAARSSTTSRRPRPRRPMNRKTAVQRMGFTARPK